jgi:hypothetical protein
LCWVSEIDEMPERDFGAIATIVSVTNRQELEFIGHLGVIWRYATPLTNEEIKQFLRGE